MTSELAEIPLTKQNSALLKAYSPRSSFLETLGVAAWATSLVTGLGLIVTSVTLKWFFTRCEAEDYFKWGALTSLLIAVIMCRSVWIEAIKDLLPSKKPNDFEQDLANGIANRITVDVLRAVEIREYEDEGDGFFLELADGRVLALLSQDFYEFMHDFEYEKDEPDRRNEFPQTRIEYIYAPISGLHLDTRPIGKPLRPIGKVKTGKHHFVKAGKSGQRDFIGAEDGSFYEGSLEEVLERLKYTLQPL